MSLHNLVKVTPDISCNRLLKMTVATDCDQYLHDRLTLLEAQLATVNRMAAANDLPNAIITESGLKMRAGRDSRKMRQKLL